MMQKLEEESKWKVITDDWGEFILKKKKVGKEWNEVWKIGWKEIKRDTPKYRGIKIENEIKDG